MCLERKATNLSQLSLVCHSRTSSVTAVPRLASWGLVCVLFGLESLRPRPRPRGCLHPSWADLQPLSAWACWGLLLAGGVGQGGRFLGVGLLPACFPGVLPMVWGGALAGAVPGDKPLARGGWGSPGFGYKWEGGLCQVQGARRWGVLLGEGRWAQAGWPSWAEDPGMAPPEPVEAGSWPGWGGERKVWRGLGACGSWDKTGLSFQEV